MDEAAVPDVDPDVARVAAGAERDDVALAQLLHPVEPVPELIGLVRQLHAEPAIDRDHEPGAVDPAPRLAAPDVGSAQERAGDPYHLVAGGGGAGGGMGRSGRRQ